MIPASRSFSRRRTGALITLTIALLTLTGCLEQYQPTRLPQGALNNFLLHLQNGELDNAAPTSLPAW